MNNYPELPGYTIVKEIGRGGMSNVYYARQHNFDMDVALKVMDTSLLRNPEFGVRFFEEARTMKKLHHNHVVAVNDVGQHDSYYYLSMEFLGGGDLKSHIQQGLSIADGVRIIGEIGDALDYIHQRGYVHRDIKPENVLFRADDTAVLTDFGIARAVEGSNHLTKTGMVIGTPNYMSPEQAKGLTVDYRSDIYSLGVLLFEVLSGELPFKGDSSVSVGIKHIIEPVPTLPESVIRFQPVVDQAMAKQPEERYQSCREMAEALRLVESRQDSEGSTVWIPSATVEEAATGERTASRTLVDSLTSLTHQRLPWLLGGSALVVLAASAVLFWPTGDTSLPEAPLLSEQVSNDTLAAADRYVDNGRLAEAEASYRTVLALDVTNTRAQSGLRRLGEVYLTQAQLELGRGNFDESSQLLAGVLRVYPDHPQLNAVQSQIQTQSFAASEAERSALEREGLISRLLLQAKTAVEDGRMVSPAGRNALDLYHQVLALDIGNIAAQNGITRLVEHYLSQASQAISQGKFQQARNHLMLVIQIAPDSPAIGEVQQHLDTALAAREKTLEEQQRKQRERAEVIALSEAADQDLLQGRLIEPEGNNAYEKYQKMLLLDGANPVAQRGLTQIGQQFLEMAMAAAEDNRFDDSRLYFRQALQVAPSLEASRSYQDKIRAVQIDAMRVEHQRTEIEANLQSASKAADEGRLFEPMQGSAYHYFMAVLEIDSDNQRARDGLSDLGVQQARRVGNLVREGKLSDADNQLQTLLSYLPTHPGIASVQQSLLQAQDKRQDLALRQQQQEDRRARVKRLLQQAARDVSEDYLRRAHSRYREVLALDADNTSAAQGVRGINQRYAELIELALKRDNFEAVSVYLRGLKETDSEGQWYQRSSALVTEARERYKAQAQAIQRREQQQQQQVGDWLQLAQQKSDANELLGDEASAYGLYKKILTLDQDNPQALEGIDRIYQHYFGRIHRLTQNERFSEAEALLSEITRVDPSDRRIAPERLALSKAKAEFFEASFQRP